MEKEKKEEVGFWSFLFFIALVISSLLSYSLIKEWSNPSKPCEIDIFYFAGRILPQANVNPGTFTINRPFKEVSQWGKDGILAFSLRGSVVKLQAWRPDPITKNVFDYTEKEITLSWRLFSTTEVIEKDKKLIAYQGIDNSKVAVAIVFDIIVVLVALGSLFMVIRVFLRAKKEIVV